jgi:molybdate-binding protein/DNA-binding XRE family transcriptional regulator
MAALPPLENHVRDQRSRLGWSQDELARRTGLSRSGVGAIEAGRLVPSTSAALALAGALGCRVEDLFRLPSTAAAGPEWAWPPPSDPCRYWVAEVGGRVRLYPVEPSPLGVQPHDGVHQAGTARPSASAEPQRSLVVACCDPAIGLLAAELARTSGVRLIVLPRSSGAALALLGQGLVHLAGVHLAAADEPAGNAEAAERVLGLGHRLVRVARWEEGIALARGLSYRTARSATTARLRWIGRETGSGARRCLDELLGRRPPPRRVASDHRGVAEAIRHGWADAGVCLRLASEEAGLGFITVRHEAYDLCYNEQLADDPRLKSLVAAIRSPAYRRILGELPGYDAAQAGEVG